MRFGDHWLECMGRTPVPECSDEQFELVGDPSAVSDELIEALAALLLSLEPIGKEQSNADQQPAAA
jgi:hypothetical protein